MPPQTTLRLTLQTFIDLGVLERQQLNRFPGSVQFELTTSGRDLLEVMGVLAIWLQHAPPGALEVGSLPAKNVIKALVQGWSTSMVRALAAGPLILTDLSKLIASVSYPTLERRLTAMRLAQLIEVCPGTGRGTPYQVSSWLRLAVGPLAAAVRWERVHAQDEAVEVNKLDVEAAFLLSLPLLPLSEHLSGTCRLAVILGAAAGETVLAGVVTEVKEGRMVSATARLAGSADGWASGSTAAWLRAVVKGQPDELEIGGDGALAFALLNGLHLTLFRPAAGDEMSRIVVP